MSAFLQHLSNQHQSFPNSEALLVASLAFAKAHDSLCTPGPKVLYETQNSPSQRSGVQLSPVALRSAALAKALEAVRNQVFDAFVTSLLGSLRWMIEDLGQRDYVKPLAAVEPSGLDQAAASPSRDGLGMTAWGECSNLPDRWYQALQAALCPLQAFSGYQPSLISAYAKDLRLELQSSCKALERASRSALFLVLQNSCMVAVLTSCLSNCRKALTQSTSAQEQLVCDPRVVDMPCGCSGCAASLDSLTLHAPALRVALAMCSGKPRR